MKFENYDGVLGLLRRPLKVGDHVKVTLCLKNAFLEAGEMADQVTESVWLCLTAIDKRNNRLRGELCNRLLAKRNRHGDEFLQLYDILAFDPANIKAVHQSPVDGFEMLLSLLPPESREAVSKWSEDEQTKLFELLNTKTTQITSP